MIDEEMEERIEKEKNVGFITEIKYKDKLYVKAIMEEKEGFKYVYYEIENDEIKDIEDKEVIKYLKENYELKESNVVY